MSSHEKGLKRREEGKDYGVVKGRLQHRITKTKARRAKRNPKTIHQYKEETANMTSTKEQEEPMTREAKEEED